MIPQHNLYYINKITTALPAVLALLFFSCGSGSGGQKNSIATDSVVVSKSLYNEKLIAGALIDSIPCRAQTSNTYALYLPSYYTSSKKFPCIYLFDAHARGSLAINAYKKLSEKYGFVLIGSYFSKNGIPWQAVNEAVKTLMDDTRVRINIDPQRIYTAGFSGGARVASTIAIVNGGIAGVIGCAAGFPQLEQQVANKFDYFGMAGLYDFNLPEMELLDNMLAQNGFTHQLLTLTGTHGWAPVADFETALLWLQVNAMKKSTQQKNDTITASLKNDYLRRIAAATNSGNWVTACQLLTGMVQSLDGLIDVTDYKRQLTALTASNKYKEAQAMATTIRQTEQNQQNELARQFTLQDEQWWVTKINALNKKAKTIAEEQMNKRLINYIGLVGYMNITHALNAGDLTHVPTFINIFKLAGPHNPDCSYLLAIYYIKTGDKQKAIAALQSAAASGYSEVATIISSPELSNLQSEPAFKYILKQIKDNSKGVN